MDLLPKSFYLNADVVLTARSLLGKILVSEIEGRLTKSIIVETEAYRGEDDKGCHSFIHGKTERTAPMFEEGGCSYVYICYGIHYMLNVVTNSLGKGDAVLVRAIEPIQGLSIMQQRRKSKANNYQLSGGPGKVAQCLGIKKQHNNIKFHIEESAIRIYEGIKDFDIISTPRVGMSLHVADYANNPWRFYIQNNKYVSRPLKLSYKF